MSEEIPKQMSDKGSGRADVGTQLAHQRTDLAMERTYLADERTLLGWIRTALSMISFGFTIGKLGKVLQDLAFKGLLGNTRTVGVKDLGYFLVVLGTAALLAVPWIRWIDQHTPWTLMGFGVAGRGRLSVRSPRRS